TLGLDSPAADCGGYEPVWSNGKRVGFTTSGAYGHTVGQSIAMAMVDPAYAKPGTDLSVHVVGIERSAKVLAPSPYDPEGKAMRG
ncbi:MAG: glycine cleavage T C-terminal barrel domain-containing protein, partial [Pseudomonadota bacterium]